MEKKRSEKADAEVDKDRVVMLLMKNGSMTIDDLTEEFRDIFNKTMPNFYEGGESMHNWLMSIENITWDSSEYGKKYRFVGHGRSKSAPHADDENDNNNKACFSARKSRIETFKPKEIVPIIKTRGKSESRNEMKLRSKSIGDDENNNEPCSSAKRVRIESFKQKPKNQGPKPRGKSETRYESQETAANINGVVMIGDDFLLGVAVVDLGFKSQFEEMNENDVLYSGLCASGQTISLATERIRKLEKMDRTVLVYLGSIDIIKGRRGVDMQEDFNEFINVCREKGIFPILCTLAPIPTHQLGDRRWMLNQFNEYLTRTASLWGLPIIDIHKAFLRESQPFDEFCFAALPRSVSGMKEWIAPWSKNGRQKFREMIRKNIGQAIMAEGFVKLSSV